jgi:hypothetical protein
MRNLLWAGMAVFVAGVAGQDNSVVQYPVLVELFTSEGCSSCPPADDLLARLERTQPVVVMSEHVDYWNRIGWTDPYSSHAFSERQEAYARRFRINGPYTPQMVVDGRAEFVGSDGYEAVNAIRAAAKEPKATIRIGAGEKSATVEVDAIPHRADVYVAYAADSGTQDVLRGENKGRRLHHVAIVKSLERVGSVDAKAGFKTEVPVQAGMRLIVFVQEAENGPVRGAAMRPAGH